MTEKYVLPIRLGQSTRRALTESGQKIISAALSEFFGDDSGMVSLQIEWISTNFRLARLAFTAILAQSIKSLPSGGHLFIDLGGSSQFDPIDPELLFGLADFLVDHAAGHFQDILIVCQGRLAMKSRSDRPKSPPLKPRLAKPDARGKHDRAPFPAHRSKHYGTGRSAHAGLC